MAATGGVVQPAPVVVLHRISEAPMSDSNWMVGYLDPPVKGPRYWNVVGWSPEPSGQSGWYDGRLA